MIKFDDIDHGKFYQAVYQGVYDAVWSAISADSDMPTEDFFHAIKEGTAQGIESLGEPPSDD